MFPENKKRLRNRREGSDVTYYATRNATGQISGVIMDDDSTTLLIDNHFLEEANTVELTYFNDVHYGVLSSAVYPNGTAQVNAFNRNFTLDPASFETGLVQEPELGLVMVVNRDNSTGTDMLTFVVSMSLD